MNVKTLCLGILNFGEATGYEIKKMSQEGRFSHFIDASYGSIYPALLRLTEEGLVSCREEHQSGKPDRKVYSITDKGRAALLDALREPPAPDKYQSEFLFVMSCASLLDRDHIAKTVDERMAEHDAQIARLQEAMDCCKAPGSRFVIGYGLAIHEAARRYLSERSDAALNLAGDDAPVPEAAE